MLMYLIYTAILLFLAIILVLEFIRERDWRKLTAIAMVLMVFLLRIFQIK